MKITSLSTAGTHVRPDGVAMTEFFSAAEGAKFAETMNSFVGTVTKLGKNKRLEDLRCKK